MILSEALPDSLSDAIMLMLNATNNAICCMILACSSCHLTGHSLRSRAKITASLYVSVFCPKSSLWAE